MSEEMKKYFDSIENEIEKLYEAAKAARKKGFDPKLEPEIPPAKDVAARVEGLIGPPGVAERIRELSKTMIREEVAFKTAEEIVSNKLGNFEPEEAADLAIRAALAILTEGITAGPIEGIAKVKIKDNFDGTKYLAIYFSGPIRAAGGTEAAQTVIVGDFVRKKIGLDRYKPTNEEIERYVEEIDIYDKIMNLQYPSSVSERKEAVKNIPIEITGEATEKAEVKGFRDLPRVETNRVRGGAVLVLNDGVLSKAPKLAKIVQKIGISEWDWLKTVKKSKQDVKDSATITEIQPNRKFIADVIAGRPVFSHPSAIGGFRLRYGRSRNTGLAGSGINPATMYVVDNFLAPGTHIRTERPGKGSIVMPVDSICGPIVLLKNGAVISIDNVEEAKKYHNSIKKILFLGDLLLGYGEFLENNHPLIRSGYVPEWWSQELEEKIKNNYNNDFDKVATELSLAKDKIKNLIQNPLITKISGSEAVSISKKMSIPLHPDFTYHWHDITPEELITLYKFFKEIPIKKNREIESGLIFDNNQIIKKILEKLCLPHKLEQEKIIIEKHAVTLIESLGITENNKLILNEDEVKTLKTGLEAVNKISPFIIRAKVPHYIGARMGRPEKAKPRAMAPPIHSLFPIGLAGGPRRSILKAQEIKTINTEVANVKCPKCGKEVSGSLCPICGSETNITSKCPNCGTETKQEKCPNCKSQTKQYQPRDIDIQKIYQDAIKKLNLNSNIDVKCVVGMISASKFPEAIEKGILRSKHDLFVYKDGTIRYDMTDSPLTHFKPKEVKAPIEKLKKLGYTHDYQGDPLTSEEQILELKAQDIVIPHPGAKYLIQISKFIDELLQNHYKQPPYYNINEEKDLIGHLVMGLAPHTSAAIIGRIIGFTTAHMCYAHPLWHAAKRRNCLSGEEQIPLYNTQTQELEINPIKEIVEQEIKNGAKMHAIDQYGTIQIENTNPKLQTISLDPQNHKSILQPIKHWIKGQNNKWRKIKTALGRKYTVTSEHNMILYNDKNNSYEIKKAYELKNGDLLPLINNVDIPEIEIPEFVNILKELSNKLPKIPKFIDFKNKVRLRKAEKWIKEKLRNYIKNNYDKTITEKTVWKLGNLLKKHLIPKLPKISPLPFKYGWYSSIPLAHLEILEQIGVFSWNEIPHNAKLGMARDNHIISNYIPFNNELMRLIGYYISEGYVRDYYGCYQMNISAIDNDIKEHVEKLIISLLKVKPIYEKNKEIITPGRIHSYLIAYAWKAGVNAYNKRVPPFMYALPEKFKVSFLSAFIDGDGSVQTNNRAIWFYSVSETLLNGIGLLLNTLNIQYRIRKSSPEGHYGPKILARYNELGKKPKPSIVHKIALRGPDVRILKELKLISSFKDKCAKNILSRGLSNNYIVRYNKKTIFRRTEEEGLNYDVIVEIEDSFDSSSSYCFEVSPKHDNEQLKLFHNFYLGSNIIGQCDSDEDSILLALDALLNFSKLFLPEKRGGMMDAPLVVSIRLNPLEVDDEAWNVDAGSGYPLEFYNATLRLADPKEFSKKIPIIEHRLGSESVFEGVKFTHDTSDINTGPAETAYKKLGAIPDKVEAQLNLAEKILAVDEADVALRVLRSHFIPDIIGNLGAFAKQQFRCQKCNKKYRRVPLGGVCFKNGCGGKILPTVYKGGIEKYLEVAEKIIIKYNLPSYMSERLEIIRMNIESLFESDKNKQSKLSQYFNF